MKLLIATTVLGFGHFVAPLAAFAQTGPGSTSAAPAADPSAGRASPEAPAVPTAAAPAPSPTVPGSTPATPATPSAAATVIAPASSPQVVPPPPAGPAPRIAESSAFSTAEEDTSLRERRRVEERRLHGRSVIGIGLGYERATGDVTLERSSAGPSSFETTTLNVSSNEKIPLTLDIGGRIGSYVAVGGYAQAALVLGGKTDVGGSVGALVSVYPRPAAKVGAMLSIGAGYQWLRFADSAPRGPEIVPQIAVNFRASRTFAWGPYVHVRVAFYSSSVCEGCSGANTWVGLGFRATWL
jgi:hypothetical protein